MPIYICLSLAVVLLDQLIKYFVATTLPLNTSQPVLSGLVSIAHIRNYGAAWSMLVGQRWFFIIISLVAVAVIGYYLKKKWTNWGYGLGLALLLGGTLGNFIDRLRLGYVVDMIQLDFINFPIFNVADCALTLGVIVLILTMIKDEQLNDWSSSRKWKRALR